MEDNQYTHRDANCLLVDSQSYHMYMLSIKKLVHC